MAAVAYSLTEPRLTVVAAPARSREWPDARVYRRRRAVALLALVAVASLTAAAVRLALAGPGGGALTTSGSSSAATGFAPPPVSPRPGQIYVVQPGDTLWSIVVATGHRGDPRPEVDQLASQLHGGQLEPGQRLVIP